MMKLFLGNKNYTKKGSYDSFKRNEETELYLVDRFGKVNSLCSTFSVGEEMKKLIEKLYSTVYGDNRHISVSTNTKSIIDKFMDLQW